MRTSAPTGTTITTPVAGRYWVDPRRTTVRIAARHMFGLGRVTGSVVLRDAEFGVADAVSGGWLHTRIDATGLETGNPARDRAVHSAKYLDTAAHPEIGFRSDGVQHTGTHWIVSGTVIAHGVAASTRLVIDEFQQNADALTVRGHARIDRYAHGITAGKGLVGRWISVYVEASCYRIGDDY